jgi:DNA-binding transcriptional MerR regulator
VKIGEFARLGGVSIRALRYYDEIGLLKPEYTDPQSGYRQYGAAQLLTLRQVLALRDVGFGLEECQSLIAHGADLYLALLTRHAELQTTILQQRERLRRLDQWIQTLGAPMIQHNIQIQSLPAQRMASLRDPALVKRLSEGGQDITAMWEALWQVFPHAQQETGTTLIWHDSGLAEYPAPELLHPFPGDTQPPAPFVLREVLPVAQAAALTYRGHYADQGMTDAFAAIHKFGEDPAHPASAAVRQVFQGAADGTGSSFVIELQLPLA